MTGMETKRALRSTATAVVALLAALVPVQAQRTPAPHSSPQPSFHSAPAAPQHFQSAPQTPRVQSAPVQRTAPGNSMPPSATGTHPGFATPGMVAPPRSAYPGIASPGHLGSWLNQHSNLAPQEQERILRSDPSFSRLPNGEQQRLVQQLHQVNNLNEQQRQRRLARTEMLERLSPQERMNLNRSNQIFAAMPPNRQGMVKRAFQDLRAVPLDQRTTVLNSMRYQGVFSTEERAILADFLRVEPYEPVR